MNRKKAFIITGILCFFIIAGGIAFQFYQYNRMFGDSAAAYPHAAAHRVSDRLLDTGRT